MGFYISLNVQLLKEEIIFVLVDFYSSQGELKFRNSDLHK